SAFGKSCQDSDAYLGFVTTSVLRSVTPASLLLVVEANNKGREPFAGTQLFAELVRRLFAGNFTHTHAIESALRRIVLLDENWRVGQVQPLAQPLRVAAIPERSHLHGKESSRWVDAR